MWRCVLECQPFSAERTRSSVTRLGDQGHDEQSRRTRHRYRHIALWLDLHRRYGDAIDKQLPDFCCLLLSAGLKELL